MNLPVPSRREVRWSFYIAALAALALIVTLCWAIVQRVNQSDDLVHVAASNADQVERLSAQVDALTEQLTDQTRTNREQVAGLRAQNRAQRRQLTALVDYFRAHGLSIPRAAYTPRSGGSGGGGGTKPPKSPAAVPTPVAAQPLGPGKSAGHASTAGTAHAHR